MEWLFDVSATCSASRRRNLVKHSQFRGRPPPFERVHRCLWSSTGRFAAGNSCADRGIVRNTGDARIRF